MRRILTLLLVTSAAVATAIGCGGGDGGSSDNGASAAESGSSAGGGSGEGGQSSVAPVSPSQLNKAQYVKKAEAICTRNREKRGKELESYREDNEETLEEGGGGFEGSLQDVYLPSKEEENEELRALGAPAGDEAKVEAFLTAFERFVDKAKELEGAPTEEVNNIAIRAGELAGNYGLIECTYG